MRRVDILIARLKAKQMIRKVKEARQQRQMESQNATTYQQSAIVPQQFGTQTPNTPVGGGGFDGNNGLGEQP